MHVNFRTYYFIYISTIWKIILLLYFKPPPRIYMYFKSAYKQIHDINNVTTNYRVIEWHTRSITNIRNIHAHTHTHMHTNLQASTFLLYVHPCGWNVLWRACIIWHFVSPYRLLSIYTHTHYIYKGMVLFYMSRWMGGYTWRGVSF